MVFEKKIIYQQLLLARDEIEFNVIVMNRNQPCGFNSYEIVGDNTGNPFGRLVSRW